MRLKELLNGMEIEKFSGKNDVEIVSLMSDSRKVRDGDMFIALKGSKSDGHNFIKEAIQRGAACLVVEVGFSYPELQQVSGASLIWVKDTRKTLSELAKSFYLKSVEDMKLIGVTGTNGKTTITYLLESILKSSGISCGVIGTINYRYSDRLIPASNTTPGLLDIYSLLAQMKKNNLNYCILEVSSHALEQGRVDGLLFDSGIFTNLTPEHLDYHKTFEDYLKAKLKLFEKIKSKGCAIINLDDLSSEKIIKQVLQSDTKVLTYGIKNRADVVAEDIKATLGGLNFTINLSGRRFMVNSPLIGIHNVYNILAAFCCAFFLGVETSKIIEGIQKLSVVTGRLERIDLGQDFLAFVDYAHTEDSLKNALLSLRNLLRKRLLVVFGCGGERDRTKRPLMGKIATQLAERVFITTDNPRGEDPEAIALEILKGIPFDKKNYEVILDREKAIKRAVFEAEPGDILLVAGKGHEEFQIFKDRIIPFDDREVVRRFLKEVSEKSLKTISETSD